MTELTFFDQIWAWQHGVFHKIFEKMSSEHSVFERLDVFFDNILTWEQCVFYWMDVFFTKYGHERGDFSLNSEKKDILLTFLIHNIMQFWLNWRFFYQIWYGHESSEVFIQLKKMTQEHSIFERLDVFSTKYRHKSNVFFERMDVFLTNHGYWSRNFFVKNRK